MSGVDGMAERIARRLREDWEPFDAARAALHSGLGAMAGRAARSGKTRGLNSAGSLMSVHINRMNGLSPDDRLRADKAYMDAYSRARGKK